MLDHLTKIDEEAAKALGEYAASCSVIITSETTGFEHGTGVAVRYRNSDYIVSAAHVLTEEPNNDKILIIGRPDSSMKEVEKGEIPGAFFGGTRGKINSSTGTHVSIIERLFRKELGDIAALKIENAEKVLPYTRFHDLDSQGATHLAIGTPVVIFGFPGEIALQVQHRVTGQRGVAAFPYCTWQTIVDLPDTLDHLDPDVDFVTDFTDNEKTCDPRGMSGGGAWTIPKIQDGKLWSPNQTRLLGIQSGFYRNRKLLRLVRLESVLSLLSGQ